MSNEDILWHIAFALIGIIGFLLLIIGFLLLVIAAKWCRMVEINLCKRKNFCVECDDPNCIHAGDIEADCPKWKCDNPTMNCETCEFLKEYKREVTE